MNPREYGIYKNERMARRFSAYLTVELKNFCMYRQPMDYAVRTLSLDVGIALRVFSGVDHYPSYPFIDLDISTLHTVGDYVSYMLTTKADELVCVTEIQRLGNLSVDFGGVYLHTERVPYKDNEVIIIGKTLFRLPKSRYAESG